LSTTAVLNVIRNSSANLPSFPPDEHIDLDAVYWRGGRVIQYNYANCKS